MSRSVSLFKCVLWAIMGAWAVITVTRYVNGLGATTNLNDAAPWGLWIAFDVMAGVALAAGGFVLAGVVYIFGLEKYRPFVRPAILTAFLGYLAVAIGLQYDLGLPWHIWHIFIYPQHHSVLFEVGMCVVLYLTVLTLEFCPVVLEHPWLDRPVLRSIHKAVKRFTIPLVIAGIVLSTLHQSSLGSLFLIQPFRVHPLWYSPIVYLLFFISAAGLGLMMVTLESMLSSWYFGHQPRTNLLSGLGGAASVVLFLYVAVRLGDLLVRGKLGHAFDGSWQGFLFLFELLVSALLPAVLLAFRKVRTNVAGLAVCSALAVLGMIGYRFNICIVTFTRADGLPYAPSWMEIVVSAGVVSGAILTFIFFVENFRVAEPEQHAEPFIPPSDDTAGIPEALPAAIAAPRRYSLIFVVAAALTVGALPARAVFGPGPETTPVTPPRSVDAWQVELAGDGEHRFVIPGLNADDAPAADTERKAVKLLLINGNNDDRWVPFDHSRHVEQLGRETSCDQCHHQNVPFDRNTACSRCHRDMYAPTNTFDHTFHAAKAGGNAGCVECHADAPGRKSRRTAKTCQGCHRDMIVADTLIAPPAEGLTGRAVSYMDAMHGLCVKCHEREAGRLNRPNHARCDTCHRPEIEPVDVADVLLAKTASGQAAGAAAEVGRSDETE